MYFVRIYLVYLNFFSDLWMCLIFNILLILIETCSREIFYLGAGLSIVKSGKGQLVLIHDGHMYTCVDQRESRGLWVCVKKKMLNCSGCVTTIHGQLLNYMGKKIPRFNQSFFGVTTFFQVTITHKFTTLFRGSK